MLKKWGVMLLVVALMNGCSAKTDENVKEDAQKNESKVEQTKVEQAKEEPKIDLVKIEKEKRQKYINNIVTITEKTGVTNKLIEKLLMEANDNTSLFGDNKWKDAIRNGYKGIGNDYDTLKTYPQQHIPDEYKEHHETLLKSYETYMDSGVKIILSVEELNSSKMKEGLELKQKAIELLNKYTNDIASVPDPK
ncbi:hypothetical protein AB1I92_14485 [Bacillus mobilis]|uniref:Lipoprotein n=2 Tax=Bacillus cereus group TaxID=86661 RepID=A0A1C4E9G3_BACCE|nr:MULTISPECIES: hypothetical protein [Bacillus cereus group]MCU5594341.1 hypothetical protein [Bacillus mobilis]MCU5736442.1 hypothetical protein [Bacillus mobilis]MCU9560222.1 hypothetical protein [Bacillus mobilis]OKA36997.1 hypothetical protein BJR06_15900 [Bacillus cereus]OKA41406.1 hypothetical protein BJR07_05730 [Bacillus cereus]